MLCDTDASDGDGRPLIPAVPFRDHSDTELVRIRDHSEDRIDDVAAAACHATRDIAVAMVADAGLEIHGWEIVRHTRRRVLTV